MKRLRQIALSSLLLFSCLFAFGQKEKPTHLEKEVKCFVSNSDFDAKKCNDAIHLSQNSEEKERCFTDEGLIIANSSRFVSSITADYEVIENIGECALQIGENGVSEIATVLVVRKNGEYYLGKVVSGAGSIFKVGDNIVGKIVQNVKTGTNGKIAVIGRRMPGHVEDVGSYLQNQGYYVELFNALYQDKIGVSFEIEGEIYNWQAILDDFSNPANYVRNESNWIVDSDLPNTLMYKANQIWANKLMNEGYTIIDIGYPTNSTLGPSVFYNMELQTIFGL